MDGDGAGGGKKPLRAHSDKSPHLVSIRQHGVCCQQPVKVISVSTFVRVSLGAQRLVGTLDLCCVKFLGGVRGRGAVWKKMAVLSGLRRAQAVKLWIQAGCV